MSDERDAILVVGPALSGVTSVAGALRERLDGHRVVEHRVVEHRIVEHLGPGERARAVVFVVSAAAPMIESDARLLDAAAHTGAVVAAVSKIDVHRTWPQILATNRALLAGYATQYRRLAWVGVAADPHVGQVKLDQLVSELDSVLARQVQSQRKSLYPKESQARSRMAQSLAVRSRLQQSRVHLSGQARAACMALRTELRRDAAEVRPRDVDEFCSGVCRRAAQATADLEATLTRRLRHIADVVDLSALDPAEMPGPALTSYLPRFHRPRSENRLTLPLSAGFGLGVALTVGRLLADLAPDWTPAAMVGALVAGVALTCWVVRTRGLLAERAALDRWVIELTAGLRTAMEDRVTTRLLAAESALAAATARGQFPDLRRFPDLARNDRT